MPLRHASGSERCEMEGLELSGQVALVTGGTAGIGKAIAKELLAAGCQVAIFGTHPGRGAQAEEELGSHCKFFPVNVASFEAVQEGVKEVVATLGSPSIVVNNAGITKDNLLLRMSEEDWDAVLDVNLKSCFNLSKAVVRPMMKQRKGKIINITSVVGINGNGGQANYAASKAGLIGITKSLAKELAPRQICVNCVAPGYIETAMTDQLTEKQKEEILSRVPLSKMGKPEDIAKAVLFLAGEGGDYITGQVIVVDGGMVM